MLTILEIIRLSLELASKIVDGIPKEQQAAFWERHERRMEYWQAFATKMAVITLSKEQEKVDVEGKAEDDRRRSSPPA
jgi:hypothetical protein